MSKFDQLCNLVIERAETTLLEAQGATYYGLNPEFDPQGLTGFDQLVANFVDNNPATASEIVDAIQRNSDDPDDRRAAMDVFRNIIDSNIIVPAAPPESNGPDETENEPDETALSSEPEVDTNEPISTATTDEEEDEDENGTASGAIPPPEEDEADTFEPAGHVKSRVEDLSPEADDLEMDDDSDDDDTPTSELVKNDKTNDIRKKEQMKNLIRYLYSKRGKTPEEADAHYNNLIASGKL